MKKITYMTLICGLLLAAMGCTEDQGYIRLDDDSAPSPITDIRVEPTPGGARIFYAIPPEPSFRYVRADYAIREGVWRETRSSSYVNFVEVVGFPSTDEYEVTLYAVSSGEKASEPVKVKINPLTPPLLEVYGTMTFQETFGGVTVAFENSGEASMAVAILTTDENGEWYEIDTYYNQSRNGRFTVRGFAAEERVFGAVARDRFGSLSDTAKATVTPIFEEEIPKGNFRVYPLASDTEGGHGGAQNTIDKAIDGRIAPNGGVAVHHTAPGTGMPQHFTFDMGTRATLSRYKLWHRGPGASWAYQLGAPRVWEIYGSNNPTDDWSSWILLGTFEAQKPSGEPVGTNTAEDNRYATEIGEDYDFPDGNPPVRYIRFRTIETWGFVDYMYLGEISLWGRVEQ
ncbi:DUF5000 domain-containing lipoprotein [Parapedobacter composti]|nr:DUF5000 domain-containing lipoprotein [Parapedobacter composti]